MEIYSNKTNFLTPLHLACDDGKGSVKLPQFEQIYFIGGYAYATNARIMVKQSLEYHTIDAKEHLEGKCVHRDVYSQLLKYEKVVATPLGFKCYDKSDNMVIQRYSNFKGTPPNFEDIIQKVKVRPTISIGFDPKLIGIAAKCLYGDKNNFLKLTFNNVRGIIKVQIYDKNYDNQWVFLSPYVTTN